MPRCLEALGFRVVIARDTFQRLLQFYTSLPSVTIETELTARPRFCIFEVVCWDLNSCFDSPVVPLGAPFADSWWFEMELVHLLQQLTYINLPLIGLQILVQAWMLGETDESCFESRYHMESTMMLVVFELSCSVTWCQDAPRLIVICGWDSLFVDILTTIKICWVIDSLFGLQSCLCSVYLGVYTEMQCLLHMNLQHFLFPTSTLCHTGQRYSVLVRDFLC